MPRADNRRWRSPYFLELDPELFELELESLDLPFDPEDLSLEELLLLPQDQFSVV
jgi:hypothetical protein